MTINELKEICQHDKEDHYYFQLFMKRVSIRLTWLLIHTDITANQVTFLNVLVKITGALLLIKNPIAGVILFQLGYALDNVDGEIAHYRGTATLRGRYWDVVSSYITEPLIFLCLGIRTHLVLGVVCAFSYFLKELARTAKNEMMYEHSIPIPVKPTKRLKNELCNAVSGVGRINIITISAFVDVFLKSNSLKYVLIFYTVFFSYSWIKAMYNNTKYEWK